MRDEIASDAVSETYNAIFICSGDSPVVCMSFAESVSWTTGHTVTSTAGSVPAPYQLPVHEL